MRRIVSAAALGALLNACVTSATGEATSRASGASGVGTSGNLNTCVGTVDAALSGARAIDDAALLARAVAPAQQGKLCAARVFEATEAITVYRVSQADRANREPGRWWSLRRPTGTREQYRADNVICAEWSALDVLAQCEIRVGARFVVGVGQSVRCADGAVMAQSAVQQVYIDNDAREGRVLVDNCQQLGAWPDASGAFTGAGASGPR